MCYPIVRMGRMWGGFKRVINSTPCLEVFADAPLCLIWAAECVAGLHPTGTGPVPPGLVAGSVFPELQ